MKESRLEHGSEVLGILGRLKALPGMDSVGAHPSSLLGQLQALVREIERPDPPAPLMRGSLAWDAAWHELARRAGSLDGWQYLGLQSDGTHLFRLRAGVGAAAGMGRNWLERIALRGSAL